MEIHSTAVIHDTVKIGRNVKIGPFCYIGENVTIGDDCVLHSHVVIKGVTMIGKGNIFFQFCSIGEDCQDKKYQGEISYLEIGDDNQFREGCTVHRGTIQDNSLTKIGSNNLLMVNTHVAHDCVLGNNIILANNASLAGHVKVNDDVIVSGMSGVHQFVEIGTGAFIAGGAMVAQDVLPFGIVGWQRGKLLSINVEGLKRRGFSKERIKIINNAFKLIVRSGKLKKEIIEELEMIESDDVKLMLDFFKNSCRGLAK